MLVNTPDKATEVLNRIHDSREIVYDVETSGPDWKTNHPVGHVFTFGPKPQDTYYIPVRHAGGGNLEDASCQVPEEAIGWDKSLHWFEKEFVGSLNSTHQEPKVIVGHHLSFDLSMLHAIGFDTHSHEFIDTMVLCYLINEQRRSLSLDGCCKEEGATPKLGGELYEHIAAVTGQTYGKPRDSMSDFWRTNASDSVVWDYASGDGTSTAELKRLAMKKIDQEDKQGFTLERVHEVESRLIPVLHRMRMRGIRVNEERMHEVIKFAEEQQQAASEAIGGINVKAPTQVKAYLESKGVTEFETTKTGRISFPEKWLLSIPQGQPIVAERKWRSLLESHLIPLRDKHLHNGMVYPEFHQTRDEQYGTKTGRLSCTNPNYTAAPGKRQADLGQLFRSIFDARFGRWYEADYSNCEIRIGAHYCQAKAWVDGFLANPPIDPHTSVANSIGIPRQPAKAINLAIMTGAGKRRIASELGLPFQEGAAIVNQYMSGLPELPRWQKQAAKVYQSRGYVRTFLGRRLRCEGSKYAYRAVNRLTQGGNADIMKSALVEMDPVCEHHGAELLLSIHDAAGWQGDENPKARKEICDTMCNNKYISYGKEISIPLEVDVGYGQTWAEASYMNEDDREVYGRQA